MSLTLIIGNKNYSSWSMRAWLALRAASVAFDDPPYEYHALDALS